MCVLQAWAQACVYALLMSRGGGGGGLGVGGCNGHSTHFPNNDSKIKRQMQILYGCQGALRHYVCVVFVIIEVPLSWWELTLTVHNCF